MQTKDLILSISYFYRVRGEEGNIVNKSEEKIPHEVKIIIIKKPKASILSLRENSSRDKIHEHLKKLNVDISNVFKFDQERKEIEFSLDRENFNLEICMEFYELCLTQLQHGYHDFNENHLYLANGINF